MMTCPACHQEAEDTGLGTLLPHYLPGGAQSSQEFCPGFVQEAAPDPAPKAMPGRKVRSDKGTKRGQRKQGGDTSVRPPSQEPERVAAKPRSNQTVFVVVSARSSAEYADYKEAAADADKAAEECPYIVYQGRTISRHEKGIKVTRLGRVRKVEP